MEQLRLCSQCGESKTTTANSYYYRGQWVCSRECGHAAEDGPARHGCERGRTHYAKKRRLLREHRRNMRIMDELIEEHGLSSELDERLDDETGNTNFWLGDDSEMDESSDQEDPEAILRLQLQQLRQEAKDKQAFLEAAQLIVASRAVATALERARMQLEDLRGLR